MIKTFKEKDDQRIGKHWTVRELWLDPTMSTLVIDIDLVDALDKFADHFGQKPRFVTPRSIYCKTGHSSNSYHYKGMAADFSIPGKTPLDLAQYAEAIGMGGIGVYNGWDQQGRHIHIDPRPARTCWWVLTSGSKTPGFGGDPKTVYKLGDRSPYIILMQRKLGIGADGVFGQKTEAAIKEFQRKNDLPVDGRAGKATVSALMVNAHG